MSRFKFKNIDDGHSKCIFVWVTGFRNLHEGPYNDKKTKHIYIGDEKFI